LWLQCASLRGEKMEVAYYPGCTLKTHAKEFEKAALEAYRAIGIELKELDKWYCCGTVYSLAKDNIMYKVASVRNILNAQKEGFDCLIVLCSMCYNTLKQAQEFIKDESNLARIKAFMDEEEYKGIEILHGLELLKDKMEEIKKAVKKPLNRKYAAYYGCTLLRPKSVAIDSYEKPSIMERLIEALGGIAVEWPLKNECCGSYNIITNKEIVVERVRHIIENARQRGAEAIVTSCPLCYFNLKECQKDIKKIYPGFEEMPLYYYTELMNEAFNGKFDKGENNNGS